jgi:hypothetical protein
MQQFTISYLAIMQLFTIGCLAIMQQFTIGVLQQCSSLLLGVLQECSSLLLAILPKRNQFSLVTLLASCYQTWQPYVISCAEDAATGAYPEATVLVTTLAS